jgi:NAD(P)-dependent dehydrogenase (short-subunit alcohol dehydrogenase family)
MSLMGKVAFITGASRGIGSAVASRLAEEGASVVLAARSMPDLERVRDDIRAHAGQACCVPLDVTQEEQVRAVMQSIMREHGRLDIVVNSAGIGVFRPLLETSGDDWDRVMATNARGPFLVCREAAPLMACTGGGCIVNISSVVGVKAYVNQGAYTASKHALMGMTEVLAQELQPLGIRVHALCPGGVDTDLAAHARPDLDRTALMTTEEIAEIVMFLVQQRGNAIVDQINVRRANASPWFS